MENSVRECMIVYAVVLVFDESWCLSSNQIVLYDLAPEGVPLRWLSFLNPGRNQGPLWKN